VIQEYGSGIGGRLPCIKYSFSSIYSFGVISDFQFIVQNQSEFEKSIVSSKEIYINNIKRL